ncbi:unnamed protein product [Calicophoron daubneyi]|uniref:Histone-lysine N-methyltransferase NSD2 n=1 Tax=Calicophoron daubneyi TaxID=300641 RepID=A0AAV2T4Y3_CALDB
MPDSEISYELGDIFWAKIGSHPWWPCMIYHAPDGGSYVREKGRATSYHVQFLGPFVERAWVHPASLIPFEGKKKFDEYVQEKLLTCKDKSEKAKFDSRSTSSSREGWVQSWKEAESAMNLPPDKRIEKFGRITVKCQAKLLTKAEESGMLKLMSNVPLTLEEEAESLSTYLREEIESRTEKNPEVDRKVLEEELRTQWPSFDITTKRTYLHDKLGIFQSSANQAEKNTRKSKMALEKTPKSTTKRPSENAAKSTKKKSTEPSVKRDSDDRELDIEIHRLIVSPAQYRFQPVCPACEVYSNVPGQMFKCRGPCGRLMHPSCMRYKTPPPAENSRPDKFRCSECLSEEYLCRICGKPADTNKGGIGPVFPCQTRGCGRYFHRDCVLQWPGIISRPPPNEAKSARLSHFHLVQCPAHICNTCYLESSDDDPAHVPKCGPKETALLQCVRCPAAFHTGDLCTPAGSVEVSLSHIVCPRHYDETLIGSGSFKTMHPSWCFECFSGASDKVLCQTCPTTYHKECLKPSFGELAGDKFTCESCRRGLFPRYAQIIWAKIVQFRWWPCEIIHARNAPINILNMSHPEGTFPIHFLGSDEYQWISRGCVLPYEIGLKSTAAKDPNGTKSVDRAFSRALKRAPRAHQLYVNHVLRRGLPLTSMHAPQLPEEELLPPASMDAGVAIPEKLDEDQKVKAMANVSGIKNNYYSGDWQPKVHETFAPNVPTTTCSCNSVSDGNVSECSIKSGCIHAQAHVECDSKICGFGTKDCGNRQFASLAITDEDDRFLVFRTVNRGFGLKTKIPLNRDVLAAEYVGEVIDVDEANRRLVDALGPSALANVTSSRKEFQPISETYLARFSTDSPFVLDASKQGNLSRFINHSCEPNLVASCWLVDGLPRLGLFSTREISANEELTVNYINAQFLSTGLMGATSLCLCGADSCSSTLHLPISFTTPSPEGGDQACASQTDKRKSKKPEDVSAAPLAPATPASANHAQASTTPLPTSKSKDTQPFSVVSLLAAATTHNARRERPLIQPTTAAARASKHKSAPPNSPNSSIDQNSNLMIRPSPHEDFCYRCGDGGELLLCDKATCPKAFHLHCLGLSSPPAGIWYCPWHYCDQCGRPSTHLCWRCPNSYCEEHATEDKVQVDDLDKERWGLVKSGLNNVNTPSIVSSFHWICADHVGLKIEGPGHRPNLLSPKLHPSSDSNIKELLQAAEKGTATKNSGNHPKTPSLSRTEETENVEPTQKPLDSKTENVANSGSEPEVRRVEPLKVTLKRRLKAENNAKGNGAVSGDEGSEKGSEPLRKRPAIASPPLDKKRARVSKEIALK